MTQLNLSVPVRDFASDSDWTDPSGKPMTVLRVILMALNEAESSTKLSLQDLVRRGMLANRIALEAKSYQGIVTLSQDDLSTIKTCVAERWKLPTVVMQVYCVLDPDSPLLKE